MSDDPLRGLREYAANAILEDERLRGDLTDDQFAPIQADALREVDRQVTAARGLAEDAARRLVDQAIARVKARVQRRVQP